MGWFGYTIFAVLIIISIPFSCGLTTPGAVVLLFWVALETVGIVEDG